MTRVRVLSMYPLGDSARQPDTGVGTARRPGGPLPYGMHHLRQSCDLSWSDIAHSERWRRRVPQLAGGAVRRLAPGLQGTVGAAASAHGLGTVDVALSMFENAGLGLARLEGLLPRARRTPHLMIACWLAEDVQHLSGAQLRSLGRSVRSVSRIAVYSRNQGPILEQALGLTPGTVVTVPFGVDSGYYDATLETGPPGGGGVVAVGSDSRRDYATLFEAARLADLPMTVVCQPRNVEHLEIPRQVTLRHGVFDDDYRRLLHRADLVVTSTVAPAYPSGQSVVLEAMSMGRATLTTDSPAMRDYVEDGVDGDLVGRSPRALADQITSLMSDDLRRARLGGHGARSIRARFDLGHMWTAVAELVDGLARPGGGFRG